MTEGHQRYVHRGDAPAVAPGLREELKVSYAAALYYFARIGGVSPEEERVVEEVARDQGVDEASLGLARKAGLDAQRLRALLARVEGAFLVRDVLRVAHADGVLEENERRVVEQLAAATGLTAERLDRIHAWVERELALHAEWAAIVGEG